MPNKLTSFMLIIASFFTIGWQMLNTVNRPSPIMAKHAICIQPTINDELCAAQEAQILASVVRFVLHAEFQAGQPVDFFGSVGYATVMASRYLVTHNHFSVDLLALSSTNTQGLTGFSLYNAAGERIVHNASVHTFQVAAQDAQTLVLDFGAGYFNDLNIPSATFIAAADVELAVGTEVAQLDWDGERAYVVWTTITRIVPQHISPYLELDHYAIMGASGGGVFWQGQHIANNWAHVTVTNPDTGAFMRSYTMAALNSETVIE
ncbi:MAG: hypothetical protein H6658_14660 [Ardenticatenaceae bacterium]|nr:hypothetical protein [Ardenticatenaceae bacterium]